MSKKNISKIKQAKLFQKLNTNDLKNLKGGSDSKTDIIIIDPDVL